MLQEITELRKRIDVPLTEAKRLLVKYNYDVSSAFEEALTEIISPIIKETGVSVEQATAAYFLHRQDVVRAIAEIKYVRDPERYERENRPTIQEFLDEINGFESAYDIYDLLAACGAEEPSDTKQFPAAIGTLGYIFTFYSYYQTDTDALLEQEPTVHENILRALNSVGCSAMAERYSDDVKTGKRKDENFDYLNHNIQAFFDSVHEFCVEHSSEIFAWKTRDDNKAEHDGGLKGLQP
jgi:chorismate mutase